MIDAVMESAVVKNTVMKRSRLLFIASILVLTACESETESMGEPAKVTRDIEPIVEGNWYRPELNSTWQWQLQGVINTTYDVDVYDVDLFDVPQVTIDSLHAQNKRVICYFSAGSFEIFRDDASLFNDQVKGNVLGSFVDERWLDIRSENVMMIMRQRLDLAKQKKCDGVEPDNMDAYANNSGFSLTANDQLDFNRQIANEAHMRELAVALKNDLGQIPELVDYYDFSVNEQCNAFSECALLTPFVTAGKPIFNTEYKDVYVTNSVQRDQMCLVSNNLQMKTLILPLNLDDAFRLSCF